MHKTGLNAKPDCGIHDFTLQSLQYITSIIEAGNDSSEAQEPTMKAEGKRDLSRLVDRILRQKLNGNRVMIWCYGSVDEWCQSRRAAFWRKEVNSWLISRSDKQTLPCLTAWEDWEHRVTALRRPPPSLAHLHNHTLEFDFALNKSILNHTCTTLAVFGHFTLKTRRKSGLAVNEGYQCK